MEPLKQLKSTALPLRADDVDTDQIIPARYLTTVSRQGLGEGLFASWRRLADGSPNPEFVLNLAQYRGAQILVSGSNFGSGSSREHAVWALSDYGFRAVIASSFADIFYNNSLKNGFLPIVLHGPVVQQLLSDIESSPAQQIEIDLAAQVVRLSGGREERFEIDPYRKACLLEGLDDLGYLISLEDSIKAFEMASAT